MEKYRRIIYTLVLVVVIILAGLSMKFLVRKMIYPGSFITVPQTPPSQLSLLELMVSEDVKQVCWYYVKDPDLPFLIYFHGNAENLQTVWLSGMIGNLQTLPVNVIVVDYPGYGRSTGIPNETMLVAGAGKAIEWTRETYPSSQIILCGWSLGAAVVISAAARFQENVDALIVITAWRSLEDVAKVHYPDWMVNWLLKESYDCHSLANQIGCKTLLIHGMRDTIIPVSHSMDLAAGFPNLWRHKLVEKAAHNDLLSDPEVWITLKEFIQSLQIE